MRQGQQNRRGRGRNNNRKGPQNPLTRSFESNGPDVKVRGTPAHIAEKYMSLARDAHSSGDPVLAENYLQHAEHYNRIILAFREQQVQSGGEIVNGRSRTGGFDGDGDDYGDDDGDDMMGDAAAGMGPQPTAFDLQRGDQPGGHGGGQQPQQHFRQDRGDRPQHQRYDRQDRQERQERGQHNQGYRGQRRERYGEGRPFGGDRNEQRGDRGMDRPADRPVDRPMDRSVDRPMDRQERQPMTDTGFEGAPPAPVADIQAVEGRERREPREFREPRPPREPREPRDQQEAREPRGEARSETRGEARGDERPRRRDQFGPGYDQQPEFLRRPVRRPRREATSEDGGEGSNAPRSVDDAGSDKTTV